MRQTHVARGAAVMTMLWATASLGAAQPTAQGLTLIGLDGTRRVLSVAELEALPQVAITDSTPVTGRVQFRGPTLRALLSLVGAPEGRALRGPSMTIVVLAEASDGYKVAYSLTELDEQFGGKKAIVALKQDGGPLPAAHAPFRVIVPGEPHHARWIRQLTTLRLVRLE